MKKYDFDKLYYRGDVVRISLLTPDYIKFFVYDSYSERQQFIMFVDYYTEELYNSLCKENEGYLGTDIDIEKVGNLIIGYLENVKPIDELPYIGSIDELNNKFKDDLKNIYVESYKYIEPTYPVPEGRLVDGNFVIEQANTFESLIKKIPIKTYHLKEFCSLSQGGDPCVLVSAVFYNDWMHNTEYGDIYITHVSLFNLLNDYNENLEIKVYSKEDGMDKVKEARERFNNRVTAIINEL